MRFTSASIIIIGRAGSCDLRPLSLRVSRKHAVICFSGSGEVSLCDLGSENGTWVNGERIEKTVVLQAGDQINVGPVNLAWSVESNVLLVDLIEE